MEWFDEIGKGGDVVEVDSGKGVGVLALVIAFGFVYIDLVFEFVGSARED
jgi:hypothetical protein